MSNIEIFGIPYLKKGTSEKGILEPQSWGSAIPPNTGTHINSDPFLEYWFANRRQNPKYLDLLYDIDRQLNRYRNFKSFNNIEDYTKEETIHDLGYFDEDYYNDLLNKNTEYEVIPRIGTTDFLKGLIYYPKNNRRVLLHEKTHALWAEPQYNKISEKVGFWNDSDENYDDNPDEIYSRLMELREYYGLDPNKQYTEEEIQKLIDQSKKDGWHFNILNRYNMELLMYLFNDVAYINTRNDDRNFYAKKGGRIHIKKKNRGKFTEYCGGEVTNECILKAKKSKNPTLRKRATFALNVRKWKYADGGPIEEQAILDKINSNIAKAKAIVGTPNQFYDSWNQARLDTGLYDSQLGDGKLLRQKQDRDSTPVFNVLSTASNIGALRGTYLTRKSKEEPIQDAVERYKEDLKANSKSIYNQLQSPEAGKERLGFYLTGPKVIFYKPEHPETLIHELAHASLAKEQEAKIAEILGDRTNYLDRAKEVYARLMQLREANQNILKPNKIVTSEDLNWLKDFGTDFNILHRYDEDKVLRILNEVADAGGIKDDGLSDVYMAANGGSLKNKPTLISKVKKHSGGGETYTKEQEAVRRALTSKEPASNYSDAVDMNIWKPREVVTDWVLRLGNLFGTHARTGLSNCTLTASQWVNPKRPIGRAASIVTDPEKHLFSQIPEEYAIPGTLVIASKDPAQYKDGVDNVYHTMLLTGFADKDYDFSYGGKDYKIKKGEPLVDYSRGLNMASELRRSIPLSVYNDLGEGKTFNRFYKPKDDKIALIMMPEIVITPKK